MTTSDAVRRPEIDAVAVGVSNWGENHLDDAVEAFQQWLAEVRKRGGRLELVPGGVVAVYDWQSAWVIRIEDFDP